MTSLPPKITIADMIEGDRLLLEDGRTVTISRKPTLGQTQVRLQEVWGSGVINRSPDLLDEQLALGDVRLLNKPLTAQNIELRITDATPQELQDYRFRKRIAQRVKQFPARTSKKIQCAEITLLAEKINAAAVRKGLLAMRIPEYKLFRKWASLDRPGTHGSPLLVVDHRRDKSRSNKRVTELDETLMNENIRDVHLTRACSTITKEYGQLFFRYRDHETFRGFSDQHVRDAMPSINTYRRRVQEYDGFQKSSRRNNAVAHRKASAHGGIAEEPEFIGDLMQIDSTRLDVHVRQNGIYIGIRPYLTTLIDIKSRVVTAWEISFSPPNGATTAKVILMSCTEHPHDLRVIPTKINHDLGPENENRIVKDLSYELNFTLHPGSGYNPNGQSYIESFQGSLNDLFVHHLGGTTYGKKAQDRPIQGDKYPVYELETLRNRMAEQVDIYNTSTVHSELKMPPAMMWQLHTQDPLHLPDTISEAYASSLQMHKVERAISNGKMSFLGLKWRSPQLFALDKKVRARNQKANLYIDINDLSIAYAADPRAPKKKFQLEPYQPKYQKGLSLEVHQHITDMTKDWVASEFDDTTAFKRRAFFYKKLRDDERENQERVNPSKRGPSKPDFTESADFLKAMSEPSEKLQAPASQDAGDGEYATKKRRK